MVPLDIIKASSRVDIRDQISNYGTILQQQMKAPYDFQQQLKQPFSCVYGMTGNFNNVLLKSPI